MAATQLRRLTLLGRLTLRDAVRRVLPAVSHDLDTLGVLHGTDKALGWHGYTPAYARHLADRRERVRSMLEIGVGGGGHAERGGESLRMWRDYFPNAQVYGLDITPKRLALGDRIVVIEGDQSDRATLRGVAERGAPFDLIVDDGSHLGEHVRISLETLFPALRPGGLYVIEDLHASYSPEYGGNSKPTAVEILKSLLDDVCRGAGAIAALHLYGSVAFLEKAR